MCGFLAIVFPPLKIVIGFDSLKDSFAGTTQTDFPFLGRQTNTWELFADGFTIAHF